MANLSPSNKLVDVLAAREGRRTTLGMTSEEYKLFLMEYKAEQRGNGLYRDQNGAALQFNIDTK